LTEKIRLAREKEVTDLAKREILSVNRLVSELKTYIGLTHQALKQDPYNPRLLAQQGHIVDLLLQINAPTVSIEPADPVRLKVVYTKVKQALEDDDAVEIEGQPYRGDPETKTAGVAKSLEPAQVIAAEIVKPVPPMPPKPALPPHREPEANLRAIVNKSFFSDWPKQL
jgi:hypothetical protein